MPQLDFGNRLAIYGYKDEVEDFDNILKQVWCSTGYEFSKNYNTVENFLYYPKETIIFCDIVRGRAGCDSKLPNFEILKRLMNLRKKNFLKCTNP